MKKKAKKSKVFFTVDKKIMKAQREAYKRGVERGGLLTPAELQEITTNMISTRAYRWCRARFLHALAGACAVDRGNKSVLREVLDEIDIDEKIATKIEAYLIDNCWIPS